MPSQYIGERRSESIYRLIGVVYLVTLWPFVSIVGMLGGLVVILLDVIMGLLFNRTAGGRLRDVGKLLFNWPLDQLTWVVVNKPRDFRWLP